MTCCTSHYIADSDNIYYIYIYIYIYIIYIYLNDYVHTKSKYTVYALVPVYQKSKSFLKNHSKPGY